MTDREPPLPTDNEPPSPCNQVCRLDPATGWCLGCRRTMAEIAAWPGLPADEKAAVLARLAARGAQ